MSEWYNIDDELHRYSSNFEGSHIDPTKDSFDIRPRHVLREYPQDSSSFQSHNYSGGSTLKKQNKEQAHRFAGVAVGLASVVSEHILSHPCIVLRRQCQVHNTSRWYHLTPFTLFHTAFQIQRHQSVTTLWKGLGSTLMVKGIVVASESVLHELTPLPKDIDRHSTLKKMAQHVLLKSLGLLIVTPFYASSLVETVQSEIACERPGVFDCLVEGVGRLISFTSAQPTRLLPIWKLAPPTIIYGLIHYIISSLAKYRVSVTMKNELMHGKGHDESVERTMYEVYYPELVSTFTGNLLADTLLYPLETIIHRLYLQGTRTIIDNTDTGLEVVPIMTRYEGLFDCYTTVISEEGFAALYKGFGALILQYALHMAILKLTRSLFELMSGPVGEKSVSRHEDSAPPIQIEFNRGSRDSFPPKSSYDDRQLTMKSKYKPRSAYDPPDF